MVDIVAAAAVTQAAVALVKQLAASGESVAEVASVVTRSLLAAAQLAAPLAAAAEPTFPLVIVVHLTAASTVRLLVA